MNKVRREKLKKALANLELAKDMIEDVKEEENDTWEGMPEGLQESDRGLTMQENVEKLEEIVSNLEEAVYTLDDLI